MTEMDAGARAWLVTVAVDHYWRVPEWYELDDLIMDGHVVWARVVKKYQTDTGRIRTRGHLMRLFKISYLNHIHTLSNKRTRAVKELKAEVLAPGMVDVWGALGVARNVGEWGTMIAEAPSILQPVLRAVCGDVNFLRSAYRLYHDGTRETLNSRLCRIAGVDPTTHDLAGALRSFLSQ